MYERGDVSYYFLSEAEDVGSGAPEALSHTEMTAVPYRWLTFPLTADVMASHKKLGWLYRVPLTLICLYRLHTPPHMLIGNISSAEHTERRARAHKPHRGRNACVLVGKLSDWNFDLSVWGFLFNMVQINMTLLLIYSADINIKTGLQSNELCSTVMHYIRAVHSVEQQHSKTLLARFLYIYILSFQ